MKHLGGGLAPWNVQQYNFKTENNRIIGTEIASGKKFEAVFFHFHRLNFFEKDIVLLSDTSYDLSNEVKDIFYKDYVKMLKEQIQIVKKTDPNINASGANKPASYLPMSINTILKYYFENLRSSKRNLFGKKLLKQIKNHYYYYLSKF